MNFWYHMNCHDECHLFWFIDRENTNTFTYLWHQTLYHYDKWIPHELEIDDFRGKLKVELRKLKTLADVAIDDINITDGNCPSPGIILIFRVYQTIILL